MNRKLKRYIFTQTLQFMISCVIIKRLVFSQELGEAHEKQQLLVRQKLELQTKITGLEKDLQKSLADHEETKEVGKQVQMVLKEENNALQNRLVR